MKGEKVEIFWNKISLTGGKWSSLKAPSTETLVSHPFLGESLFLISTLWGNKELDSPLPGSPSDLNTGNGIEGREAEREKGRKM